MMVGAVLASAFAPTEYLVFRKQEWIDDCGFSFMERDVEIPRGFDGKKAKIRCFTKCLDLLNNRWSNSIAEKNRDMMVDYLAE
jgi:hypothetical protein